MGLFDKVKNLFTEEVEEEKPIKKEVRHIEIPSPRREEKMVEEPKVEEEPKKEEKFVFFDDKDFEDLEKKEEKELKIIKKEESKKEEKLPYNGKKPVTVIPVIEKKVFTPSPIISPVYGILDKNYKKDDITSKKQVRKTYISSKELTVDDVRDRAFSTIEDDLKNDLLQTDYIESIRQPVEDDLDMFGDIDNEIDENDTLGSIESLNDDIMINSDSLFDDDIDDDTAFLAQKLKEQQRKLDEINGIINDDDTPKTRPTLDEVLEKVEKQNNEEEIVVDEISNDEESIVEEELIEAEIDEPIIEDEVQATIDDAFNETFDDLDNAISTKEEKKTEKKKNKKDLTDSELLNLIDTMYEKKDDEE